MGWREWEVAESWALARGQDLGSSATSSRPLPSPGFSRTGTVSLGRPQSPPLRPRKASKRTRPGPVQVSLRGAWVQPTVFRGAEHPAPGSCPVLLGRGLGRLGVTGTQTWWSRPIAGRVISHDGVPSVCSAFRVSP